MNNFIKLTRSEMKNVLGGSVAPPEPCKASTCSGGGCDEGERCTTIDCCDGDICSAYLTCVASS